MVDIVRILKDIEISDGTVIKKGEIHEVWEDNKKGLSILCSPYVVIDLEPNEYERP